MQHWLHNGRWWCCRLTIDQSLWRKEESTGFDGWPNQQDVHEDFQGLRGAQIKGSGIILVINYQQGTIDWK